MSALKIRDISALADDDRFRYFSMWREGVHFVQATYDANVKPDTIEKAVDGEDILPKSPDAVAFSVVEIRRRNGEWLFSTNHLRRLRNIVQIIEDKNTYERLIMWLRRLHENSCGRGTVPGFGEAYNEVLKILSD